ncbi:hypothetical protein ACSESK_26620, partial [Pseudomonas aeruginosa]
MERSHFCCALRLSPGADSYGLLKTVGGLPAVSTMVRLKQCGAGGDGETADNASRYAYMDSSRFASVCLDFKPVYDCI